MLTSKDYMILVNRENEIPKKWQKKLHLVECKDIDDEDILLEKKTYEMYQKLTTFLEGKKVYIGLNSGYRTSQRQQEIYDEFVEKYGKEYAYNTVAPIGHSEHETGLAIDITVKDLNGNYITEGDELLKIDFWFRKKIHPFLHQFGFILRYPHNKEKITGYSYEPWHIRYVGKKLAEQLYESDLCLEEYYSLKNVIKKVFKNKENKSESVKANKKSNEKVNENTNKKKAK